MRDRPTRSNVICLVISLATLGWGPTGCRTWTKGQGEPPRSLTAAESELADEPDVATGEAVVQPEGPPLGRDEIRVVVRAKMPKVRACFDAGLARNPEIGGRIGGRVLLRFTIGPDGRAEAIAVVEDELGEGEVARCLQAELSTWQFPRPRAGQSLTINYPFVFSSEQALRAAGLPRVEGTLDPAAVGAVFTARRVEIDGCIDDEADEDATPEGPADQRTIGLALSIDDSGTVTRISTYASTLDEHARACVVRTVSSWSFPPAASGDEARVNHDLHW